MSAGDLQAPFVRRLTVIGVGLIGGSFAKGLKEQGLVGEVVGVGRSLDNLQAALQLGIIDRIETNPRAAVKDADVVLLATPVASLESMAVQIANELSDNAIISDVGSVKQHVIDHVGPALGEHRSRFVPGHPIAGAEKSGAAAAQANLYLHRKVVLTPTSETDPAAVDLVRNLWLALGADVREITPQQHDETFAVTSHLPHMLAYGLMHFLLQQDHGRHFFDFAAGGFRDFTRIASSDPIMWRDICLTNSKQIGVAMQGFIDSLSELRLIIEKGDAEALETLFAEAKQHRDEWLETLK